MSGSGWPDDVKPITVGDLKRLGLGPDNQLFWDGRAVEIRRKLSLTWPQSILATLAAVATIMTGLNNASVYLCARDIHILGCPVLVAAPVLPGR